MRAIFADGGDPMEASYRMITTSCERVVGDIVALVAEARAPLIIHCTSGKDRTGVIAALLQLGLGVHEAVVHLEYLASGHHVESTVATFEARYPEMASSIPLEQRRRMAGTDASWLAAALAPIIGAGGIDRWLSSIGVSAATVDRMRTRLLINA